MNHPVRRLLSRSDWPEAQRVTALLRQETVGGALLLMTTLAALIWANSPWRSAYEHLSHVYVGPQALGIHLSLSHWAADGLLAIFFFIAGLELKHEFVHGTLRDPAKASVPIIAAACGVAAPALLYAGVQLAMNGQLRGWAIPSATDIAFALAVLAVIGTHLPSALRAFLLTLAVVDDLIAICIIALFYSSSIKVLPLALGVLALACYALMARYRIGPTWLLIVPGVATWLLVLNSGIHATIAGVACGLVTPAVARTGERESLCSRLEHRIRPLSAGVCVPLFAFFAAGVSIVDTGLAATMRDPVTIGIIVGLVAGKVIGVFGGTYLTARFTRAELDDDLTWSDLFGLSLLAGIGFTVSLLIGELAFGEGTLTDSHVKVGVLTGSLLAAVLASIVLRARNAAYRRIEEAESRDDDGDGISDCYQTPQVVAPSGGSGR